jgi:hypothetical protein
MSSDRVRDMIKEAGGNVPVSAPSPEARALGRLAELAEEQGRHLEQLAADVRWGKEWIIRGAVISLCLTIAGAMLPFCAM